MIKTKSFRGPMFEVTMSTINGLFIVQVSNVYTNAQAMRYFTSKKQAIIHYDIMVRMFGNRTIIQLADATAKGF